MKIKTSELIGSDYIVDVIDRIMLDAEHMAFFKKPWLVQWPDGTIEEYDTEEEACARQREVGREKL